MLYSMYSLMITKQVFNQKFDRLKKEVERWPINNESKLLEMLKSSNCETLKEKMRLVMNTFISARQMGECEAFYKIMPNFHLKDSNVTTIMLPTGTKETRSKFMIKVDDD